MQNIVGPTLVAMATKIRLGVEIQSPIGLFMCSFVLARMRLKLKLTRGQMCTVK